MEKHLKYDLKLIKTASAAGYFLPTPSSSLTFDETILLLNQSPLDDFLHRYALNLIADYQENDLHLMIDRGKEQNNTVVLALACERLLMLKGITKAKQFFSMEDIENLQRYSPLINIRSALGSNRRLHTGWIDIFKKNMTLHTLLPPLEQTGLPPICQGECAINMPDGYEVKDIHQAYFNTASHTPALSLEETAQKAMKCLENAGVELDKEMRHQSSLSPFALLRKWNFKTSVHNKRNRFSMAGTQTSYGKGLTLEQARASLLMEIVERCSAFASFSSNGAEGYKKTYPLTYGRFNCLLKNGIQAVKPGEIALEVEYKNEHLHWIEGITCTDQKKKQWDKKHHDPCPGCFFILQSG